MKGFVYRKKLSDPTSGSQEFGGTRFLVSSEQIFKSVQSFRLGNAGAVSPSGEIYLIGNEQDRDLEELSRLAAAKGRSHGIISKGVLKHIFLSPFHPPSLISNSSASSIYPCSSVSMPGC